MGRSPGSDKNGLKKGPWTPEEDTKLIQYIEAHGAGNWRNLPKNAGLERCGKSCRLRWTNYLRPDIKRGRFSFDEEETIIQLHSVLGNKWSAIAARLPGRTDNEIKNYWNTHIRKRLLRMGIDPVTHAPRLDLLDLSSLLRSPQLNLQSLIRLQTLLNPEALRLAMTTLISSNGGHSNLGAPPIQPNQFDYITDQQIPPNVNDNLFLNHSQLFQDHNFMPTATASDHQSPLPNFCYGVSDDQTRADLSENSSFQSMNSNSSSNNNSHDFSFDSLSSSSPSTLNSDSALIKDERESNVCSNLLRFEIPVESWDLDDFMQEVLISFFLHVM